VSLLDEITVRGAEIRERLRQLFHRCEYPQDTKTFLLRAYVDIALEHHDAIWLLAKCKLNGSAFAMVRLVYDAMFRALWINKVATEQQIERAIDDKLGFDINKILDQIKEGYFSDRPRKKPSYQTRCSDVLERRGDQCAASRTQARCRFADALPAMN
jgi:hypothetical protein